MAKAKEFPVQFKGVSIGEETAKPDVPEERHRPRPLGQVRLARGNPPACRLPEVDPQEREGREAGQAREGGGVGVLAVAILVGLALAAFVEIYGE